MAYREPKIISVICPNSFLGDTEFKDQKKTWEYTGVVSTQEQSAYCISVEEFKSLKEKLGLAYKTHLRLGTKKNENRINHMKNIITRANENKHTYKVEPNQSHFDNLKAMVDEWKSKNSQIEARLQKLPESNKKLNIYREVAYIEEQRKIDNSLYEKRPQNLELKKRQPIEKNVVYILPHQLLQKSKQRLPNGDYYTPALIENSSAVREAYDEENLDSKMSVNRSQMQDMMIQNFRENQLQRQLEINKSKLIKRRPISALGKNFNGKNESRKINISDEDIHINPMSVSLRKSARTNKKEGSTENIKPMSANVDSDINFNSNNTFDSFKRAHLRSAISKNLKKKFENESANDLSINAYSLEKSKLNEKGTWYFRKNNRSSHKTNKRYDIEKIKSDLNNIDLKDYEPINNDKPVKKWSDADILDNYSSKFVEKEVNEHLEKSSTGFEGPLIDTSEPKKAASYNFFSSTRASSSKLVRNQHIGTTQWENRNIFNAREKVIRPGSRIISARTSTKTLQNFDKKKVMTPGSGVSRNFNEENKNSLDFKSLYITKIRNCPTSAMSRTNYATTLKEEDSNFGSIIADKNFCLRTSVKRSSNEGSPDPKSTNNSIIKDTKVKKVSSHPYRSNTYNKEVDIIKINESLYMKKQLIEKHNIVPNQVNDMKNIFGQNSCKFSNKKKIVTNPSYKMNNKLRIKGGNLTIRDFNIEKSNSIIGN